MYETTIFNLSQWYNRESTIESKINEINKSTKSTSLLLKQELTLPKCDKTLDLNVKGNFDKQSLK